jgi:hypothetical protein
MAVCGCTEDLVCGWGVGDTTITKWSVKIFFCFLQTNEQPKRPPYQVGTDPPPPPPGYWRRIGGMHCCLQLGFVNTLIHEKGPGECPKCHEIGPCWYLCSQCADDGYLCIRPQWTVGQAGVLTNPTSIANVAHLLANYLKVQASPEVREKSRQHFDFLLNIHRPESNSMVAPSPFQLPKSPETGFCVNCQNCGPCWGLCWFGNSCTTEGHLFAPMDSGPLVDDPTMLNWIAKLAAFHLPHDLFPMAGCIHFQYMVDAYVAVLAPV